MPALTDEEQENIVENVLMERLGFCGCGDHMEAAEYLYHALDHVKRRLSLPDYTSRLEDEQRWIGPAGTAMFVFYVLDDYGLTEHGGSVMNGWLTREGERVWEQLHSVFSEEID